MTAGSSADFENRLCQSSCLTLFSSLVSCRISSAFHPIGPEIQKNLIAMVILNPPTLRNKGLVKGDSSPLKEKQIFLFTLLSGMVVMSKIRLRQLSLVVYPSYLTSIPYIKAGAGLEHYHHQISTIICHRYQSYGPLQASGSAPHTLCVKLFAQIR